MLRVALTGGVASGKSTVARCFSELGVPIIDTDELARKAVEPGTPGLHAIIAEFGESLLSDDGFLDRKAMRKLVFSDPAARQKLENITHPLVFDLLKTSINALDPETPYAIIEIPLLVETGMQARFDRTLVVDCDEQTQLERLSGRDGISESEAMKLLSAQVDRKARLAVADDVIENSGLGVDALRSRVAELDRQYRQTAPAAGP